MSATREKVSLTEGSPQAEDSVESSSRMPGPGEAGYVPPSETVPLPSRGKVYPVDSPLYGSELIEIRSMTAREEDILTSRALLRQGKALSTLLRSCIINKGIDPDAMLIGDRNAVTVAIRITGYGAEYSVPVTCPACEQSSRHEFNLANLSIKPLEIEPITAGENAFRFDLPASKKEVVFRFLTGADERELSTMLEKTRKLNTGNDAAVTSRLLQSVVSIGGERGRERLSAIVRNLPAKDSRAFRKYIDANQPGLDMTQEFECKSCNEKSEVDIPIGTEFLWPS